MNNELKKNKASDEKIYLSENLNIGLDRDIKNMMSIRKNNVIYTIVYSGNIYNKDKIRKDLIDLGYLFTGDSDIEVLLYAYIEYKERVLLKLNGVFSFAIWNSSSKELFIARDHLGIKPLYYTICNEEIVFATEIKAILKYPKVKVKVDKQGLAELFGLRPMPYTRNRDF